ncbi:MAG: flagellar biosynthesis anti-sigma factor FlgM [Sulfurimonas sp.]|uniref:flagellar biosynthesis anti-sigma factor FlgM n=1 Tax=Sulfurimonas sp. TaxID=2022749 RepID=UPI00260759BA|nr:flagellar biosynthesis anti-sigma factor FlgM [Sulfurimonas sp.]MCW8896320.1 flagellar biosynthesis anti-sigma factor FlgM [Sulfurimonas sp.]MCW8953885.1 flagellar biosynthesis anti-sigma factor FlgM [Sulfurimonas sp.]MCW9068118.1 flagellar biosynthesis anti-sigma factor FlgM [Sulfurimonas sp.]
MISHINNANIRSTYANNIGEKKEVQEETVTNVSEQGDTSKVERIKEALESGEYKINLEALSKKIADELM